MAATIDYKTYPEIIDCILGHAPVSVLLAISATCKELHERVLRGHFDRHAVLGATVSAVEINPVKTVTTRRLALFGDHLRQLSIPFVPRAIEILDLSGDVKDLTGYQCSLFQNVKIIRRFSGAWWSHNGIDGFPPLDTLVDFINLNDPHHRHCPVIHVPTRHRPGVVITHIRYSHDVVMRHGLLLEGNTDGGIYVIILACEDQEPRHPAFLYPLLASILDEWQGKTPL